MPWSEDHKQGTRERIVAAAAAAIREHGPDGVSVAAIMKLAGLTHGGFYAHFASKEALVTAALAHAMAGTLDWLDTTAAQATGEDLPGVADIADAYLSAMHFEHPERGCPLAACGPEIARADEAVRTACGESLHAYLRWLGEHSHSADRSERAQEATGALAAMIGGMILARAAADPADPAESRRILTAVRAYVRRAAGDGQQED